jgi:hypothetical protein
VPVYSKGPREKNPECAIEAGKRILGFYGFRVYELLVSQYAEEWDGVFWFSKGCLEEGPRVCD